jgi:positive regulator of sigma E activity
MPEEIGTVIQKTGGTAAVRIPRTSMCTGCHSCILSRDGTAITVTARDTLHAKIGDRVKLEERQSGRVKAGFLLLILPLVSFFPGYIAGAAVSSLTGALSREAWGILIGLLTFSTPWLTLFILNRRRAGKARYQMHIVRIIERST